MKVYISGQITGLENYAELFEQAEHVLKSMGFEVINPCNLPHEHDKLWKSYMKEDIMALLDCDAIFMLKNWSESSGAKLEYHIASRLKLDIMVQR